MKRLQRKISLLTVFLLIGTPILQLLANPAYAKVSEGGKKEGHCAENYYEENELSVPGTIIKDESWTDSDSSKAYTVEEGKIITVVFIKSGKKEGFCLAPITTDGSYNDHYTVSGIGTRTVTVTETGLGQDISHTEFIVTAGEIIPETCVIGENVWAENVVSSNQNGTSVAANRSDVSEVLEENDSVDNVEGTFYSLGLGGNIVISFEYPITDEAGNDLNIYEVTWGGLSARNIHKESASVEVSQDGIDWIKVTDINNQISDGKIGVDFSSTNLPWIKYVKITDTTKIEYPNSPSTDGFDIDAVEGLNGTCGAIDENDLYHKSDVTICKLNEHEQYQSGWNLSLLELVDEVEVQSRLAGQNTNAVVSTNLEKGSYIFVASGTYEYWNWSADSEADAGFSFRPANNPFSCHTNDVPTWVSGDDLNSVGYLEVRINNQNVDWGDFNEDHIYKYAHSQANDGIVDFTILDSSYTDNSGSINVKIYKVAYTDTTDLSGCVEFENVDYGNYLIDELAGESINADKWVNLSGLDEVEINNEVAEFYVINNFIDPAELVIEKIELDADNFVKAGDVITYQIRFANIGEDTAHNVIVTENVPEHTSYTGVEEGWTCDENGLCIYSVGDLEGQDTTAENVEYQTITFTVTVDENIEDGDEIENTATISSDEDDENTENNSDDADDIIGVGGSEEEDDDESDEGNEDENENDDDGDTAGEGTQKEEEKLVKNTIDPIVTSQLGSVLGASTTETSTTKLAKTGSAYNLAIAGLGIILIAGCVVELKKAKK